MKVLITGASSGIGLSAAMFLIHNGFEVIGTSRDPLKLDVKQVKQNYLSDYNKYKIKKDKISIIKNTALPEIINNFEELFNKIEYFKLDVTDNNSVSTVIPQIMEKGVEIIVNNAGGAYFGPIETLSLDHTRGQFELNYFSHINVIQKALPYLRERKGRIINIASYSSAFPVPFQGNYSTTKAAIKNLSEVLALELVQFGIKVSSICPGVINTPFNSNIRAPKGGIGEDTLDSEEINSIMMKEMIDSLPLKKDNIYYEVAKRNWEYIVKRMITSPSPHCVSKAILKVISSKKPKLHYYPASIDQYLGYLFYRRLSGDKSKFKILKSMNKL
jgi:short-subunit dehydrogenase